MWKALTAAERPAAYRTKKGRTTKRSSSAKRKA
jgi:hypothetical protein